MGTLTSRAQIYKAARSEVMDPETALHPALDRIDSLLGFTLCTSASRPANPFEGQTIHETDTDYKYILQGGTWRAHGIAYKTKTTFLTTPNPTSQGMLVYLLDERRMFVWNGFRWQRVTGPPGDFMGFTNVPNGKYLNNAAQGTTTLNLPFKYDVYAIAILVTGFSSAVADNGWAWEKTAGVGTLDGMSAVSVNAPAGKWVSLVSQCVITGVDPDQNLTFRGLVQVSTTDAEGSYFSGRIEYRIVPTDS